VPEFSTAPRRICSAEHSGTPGAGVCSVHAVANIAAAPNAAKLAAFTLTRVLRDAQNRSTLTTRDRVLRFDRPDGRAAHIVELLRGLGNVPDG
jgi:hypothetical protein